MIVHCRICDAETEPYDDAVLLCAAHRANPAAAAAHITAMLAAAQEHADRLLGALSAADTARLLTVAQARRAARLAGTLAAFRRRYAATLEQPDALADVLAALDALTNSRAWAKRAHAELDALAHAAIAA